MFRSRWISKCALVALTFCGALAFDACASREAKDERVGHASSAVQIDHAFDLDANMPAHLAVMFSMSWFGMPASDPQGKGPDPSYGQNKYGYAIDGGCTVFSNPATCSTCVLRGASDACLQTGTYERSNASRRRPLAGIYSASAKDAEGLRRVDLMLSNLRRPCDDGAKLDAWTVQLDGTYATDAHASNPSCVTCNIAYGATVGFLNEADRLGMKNVIIPGDDATWYFHFGSSVGLGTCDDSTPANAKQKCIDALTEDFVDMSTLAAAHDSALKIAGKPVLFTYLDPAHLDSAGWAAVLQNARNASGMDFYVVSAIQNSTKTEYFDAFDGIAPWINLNWDATSGATVRAHAEAWSEKLHHDLASAVGSYPGRVVFGGASPGFDDFTMNWGTCTERQLPEGDARDPAVLDGEFDYFESQHTKGVIMETWDDWTEGTEFEPDVLGGTAVLTQLRDRLGALYGEAPDPDGDKRLDSRWTGFGRARSCLDDGGIPASLPSLPPVDLSCPEGGLPGVDSGPGTPSATSDGGASANGASPDTTGDSGCACSMIRRENGSESDLAMLLAAAIPFVRRRAKRTAKKKT